MCFALGNAAYHSDTLYEDLRDAIPLLTQHLRKSKDEKTRSNAAGALGNLVRNSVCALHGTRTKWLP